MLNGFLHVKNAQLLADICMQLVFVFVIQNLLLNLICDIVCWGKTFYFIPLLIDDGGEPQDVHDCEVWEDDGDNSSECSDSGSEYTPEGDTDKSDSEDSNVETSSSKFQDEPGEESQSNAAGKIMSFGFWGSLFRVCLCRAKASGDISETSWVQWFCRKQ